MRRKETTVNDPLKSSFLGEWKVITQKDSAIGVVEIRHGTGDNYEVIFDTVPTDWSYVEDTGTLRKNDGGAEISFWRNPRSDVIFSFDKEDDGIWMAQRIVAAKPPPSRALNRAWTIKLATGQRARPEGSTVSLRALASGEGFESPLYGIYYRDHGSGGWDLYDVLFYDGGVMSFNSIFRVRSLNYWPGSTPNKDRIFASFDGKFMLPAGHFGGGVLVEDAPKVGRLMPVEQPNSEEDDPDTGVWVGQPGG